MLLLLYCLALLFKVSQRSVSCCCGWLWCLPLLFKVLQRGGSCCCCYLYIINVYGLTEEWFMLLLLYCLSLLF